MQKVILLNEQLKLKGYRITSLRSGIIKLLDNKNKPLAIQDILFELSKEGLTPNKTSVYREIYTLLKEKIIEEFDLGEGKKRYELSPQKGHHHHLICTSCGKLECLEVDSDLEKLTKQIELKTKYKILKHNLDFKGLCEKCKLN